MKNQLREMKALIIFALIILIILLVYRYSDLLPKPPHKLQSIIKFELLKKDKDDCISTPCGRSGNRPHMIIFEVTTDKTYGYTQENPIKVGGYSENDGPDNERRYLNSIHGPNGEIISYTREGSCCFFRTPNGMDGVGLLDRFKITYEGLKEPVFLYLNMYDYEMPEAPYGFTARTEIKVIKKDLIFKFEDGGK